MLNQEKTHSSQGLLDWKCCSCQSYVQILLQKIQCSPHLKWQPEHCTHFQVPESILKKDVTLNSLTSLSLWFVWWACCSAMCFLHIEQSLSIAVYIMTPSFRNTFLSNYYLVCTQHSLSRIRHPERARQTIA